MRSSTSTSTAPTGYGAPCDAFSFDAGPAEDAAAPMSILDERQAACSPACSATRPWRAWSRYGDVRGNVLAGGISYFAFFSIFPAVALAFTVFGFVLQDRPDLLQAVADGLEQYLPGFVKDAQHPNGIIPVEAPGTGTLTVAGLVSLGALVLAGLGWIGAMRDGIRAVFGVEGAPGNIVTNKLRDLGVLVTIGLGVAVSAILTSTIGGAAGWVAQHVGLGDNGWVVTLAGVLVGRRRRHRPDAPAAAVPVRCAAADARPGAGRAARRGGLHRPEAARRPTGQRHDDQPAVRLDRPRRRPAGLAQPDRPAHVAVRGLGRQRRGSARETAGVPVGPSTPRIPVGKCGSLPTFGARAADRTTLAAGAVLGATGAMARGLARAWRGGGLPARPLTTPCTTPAR